MSYAGVKRSVSNNVLRQSHVFFIVDVEVRSVSH